MRACVEAGESVGEDPFGDAVAVWIALHGYVGLRRTNGGFPWPDEQPVPELLVRLTD